MSWFDSCAIVWMIGTLTMLQSAVTAMKSCADDLERIREVLTDGQSSRQL